MSHNVFKIRYTLAMSDPDMPGPRYHNVIFVETQKDGSGFFHHVTGDITSGIVYATKQGRRPEMSDTFYTKEFLGTSESVNYLAAIDRVLDAQPPPPKQKHFNIRTMRTEQMKLDGSFYEPGEPRPPMINVRNGLRNRPFWHRITQASFEELDLLSVVKTFNRLGLRGSL